MTKITLLVAMLGLSLMMSTIPFSFAAETGLEAKCKEESDKRLSPDCELLNLLIQERAERIAADTESRQNFDRKFNVVSSSMEKDDSVCDNIPDADKVADTSLGKLCAKADIWIANYEAFCENVPFTRDAVGGVAIATVFVMEGINDDIINPMKNFDTGFTFNIPDIEVDLPSFTIPVIDVRISLGSIDIPLPTINVPGFKPFGGIPTIPTAAIDNAGNGINSIKDCSI